MPYWILPENIADVLPPEARRVETLRRSMLDLFAGYGFQLVMPPLVEFVESLFTTEDVALDLKTFKLVDQFTGRQMGLRADITPQVARIDAHLLNQPGVTRLCYAGSTVHTMPEGILSTRQPVQVGAEVYGCGALDADLEVIDLMLASLNLAEVSDVHLDLGHSGILHAILQALDLTETRRHEIFAAVQRKDIPALNELVAELDAVMAGALLALPGLYGGVEVLDRARTSLPACPGVVKALEDLKIISQKLLAKGVQVNFDLAELRSAYYHTGLMFNAYADGWSNAIARGGRYDSVGEKFGRSRPATGFSLDLKELTRRMPKPLLAQGIMAPLSDDSKLLNRINQLRADGEIVVVDLLGRSQPNEMNCNRVLSLVDGEWQLQPVA